MAAIHWYTRGNKTTWSDQPYCVSHLIKRLCIGLNDWLKSDADREKYIGPHIFAPVGTKTTKDDELKRLFLCADRAVRVYAPFWLHKTKRPDLIECAVRLEALAPIVDKQTADAATPAAQAAKKAADAASAAKKAAKKAASAAASAAYAASAASEAYASSAAYAADAASAAYAASAASEAYASSAAYAADAAYAAYAADAASEAYASSAADVYDYVARQRVQLILDCCAIGEKTEVCETKSQREVVEFLCSFDKRNGG